MSFTYHKSLTQSDSLIRQCNHVNRTCQLTDQWDNVFFIDEEYGSSSPLPWLYYATLGSKMAGFISVYALDENSVEICCFVLPSYRNKKIANKLFCNFASDYENYTIHAAIPPKNIPGKNLLKNLGFHYASTQCSMWLTKNNLSKDHTCPPNIREDVYPDRRDYTLFRDHKTIGYCHVSFSNDLACLHDVEIISNYRNRGYGYSFIYNVLLNSFNHCKKVILHVTRENHPAFNLYKKLGFRIMEELEYYST